MARPHIEFRTASKENYKNFCEQHPSISISFKDFIKIIKTYNQNLINHLIETGDKVKLPYGIGDLRIVKYKPIKTKITKSGKELPNYTIDWIETKKAGKYIYYLNDHTEGYKYLFMWKWASSRLKHAEIWSFKASRIHSRRLGALLKKPNSHYRDVYVENFRKK